MIPTRVFALLAFGLLAAACERGEPLRPNEPPAPSAAASSAPAPTPAGENVPLPQRLPALYSGLLPCADCEGIRYDLDLRPDKVFFARLTYLGEPKETTFSEIGEWSLSEDQMILALHGDGEAPSLFAVKDARTLRKLDIEGKEITSQLNYDLTHQDTYSPLEPKLQLRGMYRYMADAAIFEECLTGLKLAVAQEGDNAALQAAYLKARKEPAQPLLVTLEGRIVKRPGMEGDQLRDTLIVEKTGKFLSNENCGARGVTHDLEGTRWVLVRLHEREITVSDDRREPYFALESNEHRVSGHGGCNRLIGGYQSNGDQLTFTQMALTRMACPDVNFEEAFVKALESTRHWKISGAHLELSDATGKVVARFESRNL
ncbi:MAG TPA: META domain-containing protein [Povalibacter sp.]|nr:META domain-containing protein [Povalibacter sp.]